MRRLFLLTAALVLLTACATAPKSEQNGPTNSGELRSPGTGQISPAKPAQTNPQSSAPTSPAPTSPAPTSPAPTSPTPTSPTPTSPTPTSPSESACTYPSAQTLQTKGRLLLADGTVSFYDYAWGADCTIRQPVDTWLVASGNVSRLLRQKQRVDRVRAVTLPGGEHAYLVDGEPVGAAASAFYLVVVRYGEPRFFRFLEPYIDPTEMVASTDEPKLTGDQLHTAERVGVGSGMHYRLRTWKIDPQGLTATKISEQESYPEKAP